MKEEYSREDDYDPGEEMIAAASHCSRFGQRKDAYSFSMTDYRSCANCVHAAPDSRCSLRMDQRFTQ